MSPSRPHKLARLAAAFACSLALLAGGASGGRAAYADDNARIPKELKHVGVDEHLDGQLPLQTTFKNEAGQAVRLGDYFGERPVLLIFAYYSCPVLCSMVQNATAEALKNVPWTAGKEFNVVVVSIDPRDTPQKSQEKRKTILETYGRAGSENGFHFLIGDKGQIDEVTQAAGFQYQYDERQGQYAHPAVIMLVKPNGQMARYLYGLNYDPKDLRLGLLEASEGHSITTVDRVLLYCYHYDPQEGKYVVLATNVMRLGGAVTVVVLGGFLGLFWLHERKRAKAEKLAALAAKQDDDVRGDHGPHHAEATGIKT